MIAWFVIDIAVFLTVILLTRLISQVILIEFRKNLLADPDPRKIHKIVAPRFGSIASFPMMLFTIMLAFGICHQYIPMQWIVLGRSVTGLCFLTCSVVTLYLVGMADDFFSLQGNLYQAR